MDKMCDHFGSAIVHVYLVNKLDIFGAESANVNTCDLTVDAKKLATMFSCKKHVTTVSPEELHEYVPVVFIFDAHPLTKNSNPIGCCLYWEDAEGEYKNKTYLNKSYIAKATVF